MVVGQGSVGEGNRSGGMKAAVDEGWRAGGHGAKSGFVFVLGGAILGALVVPF